MHRLRSTFVVALIATSSLATAADELAAVRAEQMKAAYLFNFLKFVEWPATKRASINVCFLAADSVHDSLRTSTTGKKVGARTIVTSVLPRSGSWSGCDVI